MPFISYTFAQKCFQQGSFGKRRLNRHKNELFYSVDIFFLALHMYIVAGSVTWIIDRKVAAGC